MKPRQAASLPVSPSATLRLDALRLAIGARTLLAPLTLDIVPGTLWCVVGPNGAGKSTLLSTLAGLRPAQGGHVRLAGEDVHAMAPAALARQRAFLPQTLHDTFSMPVRDAVLIGRHPHQSGWGWEQAEDAAIVDAASAALALDSLASRDIRTLSGGERQRVALAATLVQQAPLMLLDEPVAHLDLHHQIAVLDLLRRQAREHRKTIVLTIHDVNLARAYGSDALLLPGDGTVLHGPAQAVLTAEHCSRALRTPMITVSEGGHSALVAVPGRLP